MTPQEPHPVRIEWRDLDTETDVDTALAHSTEGAIGIYKHSPRCGASFAALSELEDNWVRPSGALPLYRVDVVAKRDVSRYVADRLGVLHQSPQFILVKNGRALYRASHYDIRVERIEGQLANAG